MERAQILKSLGYRKSSLEYGFDDIYAKPIDVDDATSIVWTVYNRKNDIVAMVVDEGAKENLISLTIIPGKCCTYSVGNHPPEEIPLQKAISAWQSTLTHKDWSIDSQVGSFEITN